MRITTGSLKGRRVSSPAVKNLRLTEEKVRKAIFDALSAGIKENSVLELFAGSGALGIEAFSRGASEVTFVDNGRLCIQAIKRNIPSELKNRSLILFSDCLEAIGYLARVNKKFDLVILDPPYRKDLAILSLKKIVQYCILKTYAVIVAEHHREEKVGELSLKDIKLVSQKKYGLTRVSFFIFSRSQAGKNGILLKDEQNK